jgi:hypothetical protein
MLIQLLDAQDVPHWATWQGQDQINDWSGTLGAGAVGVAAAFQVVLPVNALRAGWLFQNTSLNPMLLQELGSTGTVAQTWNVAPGAFFPPYGGYPIPTTIIQVVGSQQSVVGDTFTCREWVNGPTE